jgi:hypothetical protein
MSSDGLPQPVETHRLDTSLTLSSIPELTAQIWLVPVTDEALHNVEHGSSVPVVKGWDDGFGAVNHGLEVSP